MTTARDLATELAALLRRERHALADFLLALASFDRRRAWLDLGHASLFSFLRRELGLSAGAAQYRKTAAELVQRLPEVEQALREGKLCLSSVIELAKVVTPENVGELLPRFFGLSAREAAVVAVSIRPVESPPVMEIVTPVRRHPDAAEAVATSPSLAAAIESSAPRIQAPSSATSAVQVRTSEVPCPEPRPSIDALDADRVRLHLTVSRRLVAKLDAARSALSHARPGATSEEILEAALDALLASAAKRRGAVAEPRTTRRPAKPSTVTAATKREVWSRSGGCCEWPVESGGACGSTLRLEIDHVRPRAMGGASTPGNLRLLCAVHNQLDARQAFGDGHMARCQSARRRSSAAAPPSASVTLPLRTGGANDASA